MSIPPLLDLGMAVASAVMAMVELRRWRDGRGRWQWVGIYAVLALAFLLYWFFAR